MKKLLRQCFMLVMLSASASALAHDFEADNNGATIYYTITSVEDQTVCVTFKGDDFRNYTNRYTGSVEIPGSVTYEGAAYTVTSIAWGAFYGCSSLKSVIIPDEITLIDDYAFYNCSGVTAVIIPDTVTTIGANAFNNCSGVKKVVIGESVTSIGAAAFRDCRALNSLTLGNSVITIGDYAFYSCPVKEVVIPDSVVTIGNYAFGSCTSLTSLAIGESVAQIGNYAFSMCNKLTTVTMGPSVTVIGEYAFTQCRRLTSITIPQTVTFINTSAFYNCSGMTSMICRKGNPSDITLKNTIFAGIDKSKCTLYVPSGSRELYADAAQWKDFVLMHEIGDINGDSYIAIEDVTTIIEMIMSGKTTVYADIDGDGEVNVGDITAIINIILGQ